MDQQAAQNPGGNNAQFASEFFKYWTNTFSTFSWSQQQSENLLLRLVEEYRLKREDANKIIDELVNQAQKNQEQLFKIVKDGVNASYTSFIQPIQAQIEELSKKIDVLTQNLNKQ